MDTVLLATGGGRVIRFPRSTTTGVTQQASRAHTSPLTARARMLWTIGNVCMLAGLVMLLYVGGLYATDEYGRYAARGDTDVPVSAVVAESDVAEPAAFVAPTPIIASVPIIAPTSVAAAAPVVAAAPEAVPVPDSNTEREGQLPAPGGALPEQRSLVSRVIIPSIKLDAKVVEVGWEQSGEGDQSGLVWQVAKYAVGQHRGSANPGEGGNIVLAGHVGGYGQVFRDLFYVHPGEEVRLFVGDQEFRYTIKERLVLDEEGAPPEQRAANAQLIGSTDSETVTLVTCWPGNGPNKFKQRVVVRAVPA